MDRQINRLADGQIEEERRRDRQILRRVMERERQQEDKRKERERERDGERERTREMVPEREGERERERERERETERERRKEIKDYKSISRYIIKSRGNFSSYRSHQLNRTKAIDISSVILVKIVELIIYHKRSFYIFREGE